ncbi:MAG: GNAT family N-acetyltransferase [Chloroflexota bacterium]|nr:GNAT family N-acetyltransferase [Chloroflexota bacterium]
MNDQRPPTAPFLTGSRLGLRHPVLADARNASSWHEGPFPISETQAEELLRSTEIHPWGSAPATRLIVDSVPDGVTLGGAVVERQHDRIGRIRLNAASWLAAGERDEIHAAILDVLLPWMLGELDLMVVTVDVTADHAATMARAASLGMREVVRLREHIRRPDCRVDLLTFEIVNPSWNHALRDRMEQPNA